MTTLELFQWWLQLHWAWGMLLLLLVAALLGGFFLGTLTEISSGLRKIAGEIHELKQPPKATDT